MALEQRRADGGFEVGDAFAGCADGQVRQGGPAADAAAAGDLGEEGEGEEV